MKNQVEIERQVERIGVESDKGRAAVEALDWVVGMADLLELDMPAGPVATIDEIDAAIQAIREARADTPQFSVFGDNNWEQLDAQIEQLEWVKSP